MPAKSDKHGIWCFDRYICEEILLRSVVAILKLWQLVLTVPLYRSALREAAAMRRCRQSSTASFLLNPVRMRRLLDYNSKEWEPVDESLLRRIVQLVVKFLGDVWASVGLLVFIAGSLFRREPPAF
jgi:hypothetical protein